MSTHNHHDEPGITSSQWWLKMAKDLNPWENIRHMGDNVGTNILSGITVAVIAMPLALAFGVASGLGPASGMWAAICGGIFVGIFGGSRFGISGPTGPKVVQLAAIVTATKLASGEPDITFVFSLVFLSGLLCLILGLLKVGKFIYYTPYSAVSGFMCGIGAIIILLEIPPMLGFPTPKSVVQAIQEIPYDLLHENWQAVTVSLATFGTILIWPRIARITWLPGPLVGLAVGTAIANIFRFQIDYIPAMPVGLPELHMPDLTRFDEMIGPAAALAGLAIFDSLLTCLIADNMTGDRHQSDREIVGQGVANMACGIFGGVTTATATMRTVANIKCGGTSGLASIVHGLVLLGLMLGLAPLASYIPMACLAGILLKVGFDIIDYRILPVLHRMPLADGICFWAVFGLTIATDLLVAMGVGIAIAFIRAVHEMGNLYDQEVVSLKEQNMQWPRESQTDPTLTDRTLKLRLEGPLFFGVSSTIYNAAARLVDFDYLVIRMRNVPTVDLSGAYLLDDVLDRAHREGAKVLITGMNERVRTTLEKLRIIEKVGEENCFDHFDEAAARIEELEAEYQKSHIDDTRHKLDAQSAEEQPMPLAHED
ncbi:SulP family inorganic anion transporter [Calycomorphotria hydatis]|uniref:Bicarbonate transporter BicA n=1 Tax=Calycomorphotria hydatis TaxID=2528027 RepID=A0A517T3S5_9PLAN|nr:SulP family inorganic anion transporter [Calycomorphotria hydatis]QDT63026.1 Bicarbonate transporter BicA [Calycomorphotria hydatis]